MGGEIMNSKKREQWLRAISEAKQVLKPGDRIRCSRCGGIVATYTFDCWDGYWIVSRSGIDDISPTHISKLNGQPISFGGEQL